MRRETCSEIMEPVVQLFGLNNFQQLLAANSIDIFKGDLEGAVSANEALIAISRK